ncbi:pyrroline-5-carboxylate reductase [Ensifer sp. ENS04]|uniref:pyrroline-5-carboxylate reductase n=1 Tax=Ensifer sp. ENS04 TaxID=2769281 RepID=UPI001782F5CB|nr:pyrroline-5-carboxylate reductase [Ensifer sp. ENS04]MBD9538916.1 pyrroline-5-carboxylate reductase [Ensifer sp. ENS04]
MYSFKKKDAHVKVLVIGCGHMGAAIASAIATNFDGHVVAIDPDVQRAKSLLRQPSQVDVLSSLQSISGMQFDLGIIGVKPQNVADVLVEARQNLRTSIVVSIAAGVTMPTLRAIAQPGMRLARVMPNLPAAVNAAMSVGFSDANMTTNDRLVVGRIFSSLGRFCWVDDENQMDVATALAGSGPGYVFAFAQYLAEAAVELGITPELAVQMTRQTILGSALMLHEDERAPEVLKQAVTSPGGTTAEGLKVLETGRRFPQMLSDCVRAAAKRSKELADVGSRQ